MRLRKIRRLDVNDYTSLKARRISCASENVFEDKGVKKFGYTLSSIS